LGLNDYRLEHKEFTMKKGPLLLFIALLLGSPLSIYSQTRSARQITVKLASLVPANTPWGSMLNRMASEWTAATKGDVRLVIYPNGTQGNEADVLQKLNMNVVQAAVLTSFGLHQITPEILALSCPFLIRDDEELTTVLRSVKSDLEARINSKGYFSLAMVRGGWVKFFSKSPVFTPTDLKRLKVGSDPLEPELAQAFRTMGYQVVPVETGRILIALNGGMVEAVYGSPIAAAGFQFFGVAKNMASVNIAPFMGGIVLNKPTWDAIPAQYKPELIRITKRIEAELEASLIRLENEAITAMTRNGLVINQVNQQQQQQWYDDIERVIPSLLGTTFDRGTYGKIDGILKTYRKGR
jgi:TRAP-type C4-dicarboxylate transport system substrate-binding protein